MGAILVRDLQTEITPDQVREDIVNQLAKLECPITAYGDESNARTFLEVQSVYGANLSKNTVLLSKSQYLGTCTGDFLTAKAKSDFDEDRQEAQATQITVEFYNSSNNSYTISNDGDIKIKSSNGSTYSSIGSGIIIPTNPPTTGTTSFTMVADVAGSASNVSAQTMEMVTSFAGVSANYDGNLVQAGVNTESDDSLTERCRTKWSRLRVDKTNDALINIVRNAVPAIHSVFVDSSNPSGPGTSVVYLASVNGSAGTQDVIDVQVVLDQNYFGNGLSKLVLAKPASLQSVPLKVITYYKGVDPDALLSGLIQAWSDFLSTIPIGGFDLSPGPNHIVTIASIIRALSTVPGVQDLDIVTPTVDILVGRNLKVVAGPYDFSTRIPIR